MDNQILISRCWEKALTGYVSTFATLDRVTNTLIRVTYHWHKSFSDDKCVIFNSFEDLNNYIDGLMESELNALENQSNEQ